jgi:flagellar basal-body rod protein FlgG
MLVGLYSAASGLTAQQTRLDAIAGDLANANTTGYKPVRVAFRDLAYAPPSVGGQGDARTGSGAAAAVAGRDHRQGPVEQTGRGLDVAVDGPGFLRFRRADGTEGLTRDGALQVDARGRLTTARGELLQPAVTLPAGTAAEDVQITRDGTLSVRGAVAGRIALVTVPNPDGLVPLGDSAFAASAASGPVGPAGARSAVVGGALERSGTDVALAMTEMIEAQRAFQLASRAISTRDEVWGIANGVKR